MLTMANHSIMTYGTFGLWAALLAGGIVTVPRYFDSKFLTLSHKVMNSLGNITNYD